MSRRTCWLFLLLSLSWVCRAQDHESLLAKPDSILSSEDSLSIFSLIDSLLLLQELNRSQMAVRVGYNSNVLSAGRTLGIQQFGLSSGISYYHKSGVYADLSGYWSQDFDPKYYLTTASMGYMHLFSKTLSAIVSYDHYFYRTADADTYIPYSNAVTVSPYIDLKFFSLRLDYSFYFGDASVHRFMPGIVLNLEKKDFMRLKRIAFTPAFYLLYGNETISELEFPYTDRQARLRQRMGLPWYVIVNKEVWGVMNYAVTAPLYFSRGDWTMSLSYSYNIPKALPGEPLTLTQSSFLSASFIYYIDLKPRSVL